MKQQTVYIRAYKKTTIQQRQVVYLKDIAAVSAPSEVKKLIENIVIMTISDSKKKKTYLTSIMQIIPKILSVCPDVVIQNLGDIDMLIEYLPKAVKENSVIEWIKVIVVSLIIFAGATIAIMAYNTDASLGKTFSMINKIFTGKESENPVWITVPYSVGIAVGIIVFFNHIGRKKITEDPSPMQIEINQYEEDVENSLISSMTSKERGEP